MVTAQRLKTQIHVEGLELFMFVGIYDHEKQNKQRVLIDMCADVDLAEAIEDKGNVDDIVSYEDFIVLAQDMCAAKHFNLLENLAQSLAEAFMRHQRVMAMDIRIVKPDIFKGSTRVGVSMHFVNPDAVKVNEFRPNNRGNIKVSG